MQGLVGDDGVEDFELDVTDGLVAERALASTPLETLHDAFPDGGEEGLVHLSGKGIVE